jgi:hypothetical protein
MGLSWTPGNPTDLSLRPRLVVDNRELKYGQIHLADMQKSLNSLADS